MSSTAKPFMRGVAFPAATGICRGRPPLAACRIAAVMVLAWGFPSLVRGQTANWPDPVANDVLPYAAAGMAHGPLLGNVRSDAVTVWLRTRQPGTFEVVYDDRLPLDRDSPALAGETAAANDQTTTVRITDLQPATRYYYGVRIDGVLADLRDSVREPWPSFRTLPDATTWHDPQLNPKGLFDLRFAIGHCASQDPDRSGGQYANTPAYETILREHRDEVMFGIVNGDVIYEERRDGSLAGIRENYQLYFERGRSFNRLFRRVPAFFTFDDHDVGWDIHGSGEIGLGEGKHLIRDLGLQGYEEYLSWANPRGAQSGRIRGGTATVEAGSTTLFDPQADFVTLDPATVSTVHLGNYTRGESLRRSGKRPQNAGVFGLQRVIDATHLEITPPARADESLAYSIGTHHYYDWQVANCHFFALDTRGERSRRNPSNRADPKIFILGDAQREWLMEGIAASDAQFIFLISPDPWTIYHTAAHVSDAPGADEDDKGDGFPSFLHERRQLIDFLDQVAKPVLIFTGDVHAAASVRITDNVWEMMCGPLGSTGHPLGTLGNPPRGGRWTSKDQPVEIRWVSGFPNNLPYQRIRNTYYGIVQVNNVLPVGRPDRPGYQYAAFDQPQVVVRWHDGYTGRMVYAESITTLDPRPASEQPAPTTPAASSAD